MAASDQIAKKLNKPVFPKDICSVGEVIAPDGINDCLRIDPPINPKIAVFEAKRKSKTFLPC